MGMEKTSPELLGRLIEVARTHKMAPAELRAQRVSFVYGQMRGSLSKEEIWERLAERFGWERSIDEAVLAATAEGSAI